MKLYPRTSRRTGFTLVELLVTIAIIAALASLGVVGARKLFQGADAATLTHNMKGIHTIMMVIVDEGTDAHGYGSAGSFPPHSGVLDGEIGAPFVWWDLVAEKAGVADRSSGRFKWTEPYADTIFQNPLSKKKLGAGLTEYYSLDGNRDVSRGGFTYNGNLGGKAAPGSNKEDAFPVYGTDVKDGPNTIFFAESNDNVTGAGWVFKTIQQVPQGNYKDQVHCCFIDGHVETIKNKVISKTTVFEFYTSVGEKDYDDQPGEND